MKTGCWHLEFSNDGVWSIQALSWVDLKSLYEPGAPAGGILVTSKAGKLRPPKGVDGFLVFFRSFWNHFGTVLGSFWDRFGIILGSFWDHFVIILGSFWASFWDRFGISLGSF